MGEKLLVEVVRRTFLPERTKLRRVIDISRNLPFDQVETARIEIVEFMTEGHAPKRIIRGIAAFIEDANGRKIDLDGNPIGKALSREYSLEEIFKSPFDPRG